MRVSLGAPPPAPSSPLSAGGQDTTTARSRPSLSHFSHHWLSKPKVPNIPLVSASLTAFPLHLSSFVINVKVHEFHEEPTSGEGLRVSWDLEILVLWQGAWGLVDCHMTRKLGFSFSNHFPNSSQSHENITQHLLHRKCIHAIFPPFQIFF